MTLTFSKVEFDKLMAEFDDVERKVAKAIAEAIHLDDSDQAVLSAHYAARAALTVIKEY